MLNSVTLTGRLTADPELRYTPSGVPVTTFRLAVQRSFKNAQGEREADFITIVAWRQAAEVVVKHLGKGRLVGIQGRLQSRSWKTQDGQSRSAVEVVAQQVTFLDRKPTANGNGQSEPEAVEDAEAAEPQTPATAEQAPLLS